MPLPSTSHEANVSMTKELREQHHAKILSALEVLKLATGEQIAQYSKLDYHAVMRRVSELERDEKVYKPGTKIPTSSGRTAFQYAIRTPSTIIPTPENHYREGPTTAADYASSLIAKTKQQKLTQQTLFNEK